MAFDVSAFPFAVFRCLFTTPSFGSRMFISGEFEQRQRRNKKSINFYSLCRWFCGVSMCSCAHAHTLCDPEFVLLYAERTHHTHPCVGKNSAVWGINDGDSANATYACLNFHDIPEQTKSEWSPNERPPFSMVPCLSWSLPKTNLAQARTESASFCARNSNPAQQRRQNCQFYLALSIICHAFDKTSIHFRAIK